MTGIYPDYQFQWQDGTGEHLFVSSHASAFQSALTLAIAMHRTDSAKAIRIIEIGNIRGECKGIYYKKVYEWGEWID